MKTTITRTEGDVRREWTFETYAHGVRLGEYVEATPRQTTYWCHRMPKSRRPTIPDDVATEAREGLAGMVRDLEIT